jgi:nicotinamidase-related amidase
MPLTLDPKSTALVLIDLQKGILGMPLLTPHTGDQVLANAALLGRRFNDTGGTVVLVHVAFSNPPADRLSQPVDAGPTAPPGGYPADWADFHPQISGLKHDVVITKRQWGAFHGTELDLQLRRRGVATIVLAGISTNFGVESTAREAWQHGYAVIVAEDACTSSAPDLHKFSIDKILPRIARVRDTATILRALSEPRVSDMVRGLENEGKKP